MSLDAIFTPPELAKELVSHATCTEPVIVADFCAGDGSLLRAALERWPKANTVATDLVVKPLFALKRQSSATVGTCDFLNRKSRSACGALRNLPGKVNVVLLNPPFSHRGAKTILAQIGDVKLTCSPALAFLINSLPYLSSAGEIVAVLPVGCMRSEKNDAAWDLLNVRFEVSIAAINSHRSFSGCFPTTAIVRFCSRGEKRENAINPEATRSVELRSTVKLLRGTVPMHQYRMLKQYGRIPFVHTTELQRNSVSLDARSIRSTRAKVSGDFVLLPRVGQPSIDKLARCSTVGAVFSDCILGIECGSRKRAIELFTELKTNWAEISQMYQGTGAPYLTVRDLAQLLRDRGYTVESYHNGTTSGLFKKALAKQSTRRSYLLNAAQKGGTFFSPE